MLVAVATVYLAIVARYFTTQLTSTQMNSDAISAQVIAELYGHNSGAVYLGNIAWYSTLLFEWATGWLPAHRAIWDVGPYAIALCSIAVMAWTAWKVAGRSAACVTAALLICASPTLLAQMFWLNNHMTTYYALALLAAYLVFLESHAAAVRKRILMPLALVVGVIVGVNMASDFLLVLVGPASLVLAGTVAWRLAPSAVSARALAWGLVAVVVMAATTVVTIAVMRSAHIYKAPFRLAFATTESIGANFRNWWESVAVLGNGAFFGETLSTSSVLSAVCAVLTIAAVLFTPRFAWKSLERWRARREQVNPMLSGYVIFWATGCTLMSLVFIFSSAPVGLGTTRYLDGVIFATAAIVPLWLARGNITRMAVVAGSLVYCVASINGVVQYETEPQQGVTPTVARDVAEAAERLHATQGYAEFGFAASLTWLSHLKVRAYPFIVCPGRTNSMCPRALDAMSSWYELPPTERTFLITVAGQAFVPQREFGPPLATYHFGVVTMTVYENSIGQYMK
ncbi:MAG TPA: hypothetical protein VN892_11390 [Solirubrobacteraceae bacterium]|nr:hypothetical protein [Solirubrobacteraceae bacterium]